MTDIQLPLHQTHQKGMNGNGNGKFLAKNTLEIRGGSVSNNNSSNLNDSTNSSKISNNSNNTLNKPLSASSSKKSSIKFIEKNQTNLANIQVYPRLIDSTYSTIVSFNLFDVKSNNPTMIGNATTNNINTTTTNSNGSKIRNHQNTTNTNNNKSTKFDLNANSLTNLSQLSINSNSSSNYNNNNNYVNFINSTNTTTSNNSNANINNTKTNANNLNQNFSKKNSNNNMHQQEHHQQHHNNHWHDESNSGWASTGVMSDRSSVYSIDDGDFDREASRKVNNQLREIESILYEQNSTHSSILVECKEWLEKFPHIRILGSQLSNSSKDDHHLSIDNIRASVQSVPSTYRNLTGVTSILSSNVNSKTNNTHSSESTSRNLTPTINVNNADVSSSATSSKLLAQQGNVTTTASTPSSFNNLKFSRRREQSDLNNQNLYLNGITMPIRNLDSGMSGITIDKTSSSAMDSSSSDISLTNKLEHVDYSFLEEEIFDEDGTYEELLAYDNQEEEYLFEHNKRLNLSKRRRHGLPPITPKASMKDLVTNFLFDHMWSELINWSSDIIQTYAKTISDEFVSDSLCKTPQPDINQTQLDNDKEYSNSTNTNNLGNSNQNNNNSIINTTQQNSINNFNCQTNNNNNNNNNNSNLNNTSNLATSLTKANVVQLKPFDSTLNNGVTSSNTNTNTTTVNPPFYHLLEKTTLSGGLLSRDNSTLYAHSNKFNDNFSSTDMKNPYVASDSVSTVGDLLSGTIDDILKIKQINRNGPININKNLTPINGHYNQNRVGSGSTNRRHNQVTNNYRKRYSSIEMSTNTLLDKNNIIIHGAGLVKPTSLNHLNDSNSGGSSANDAKQAHSTVILPLTNINNSRSANSSSQAYHYHLNEDNNYENDYNDFNYTNYTNPADVNGNNFESIDEINLLNPNNSINFNRNSYYYSHVNSINSGNNSHFNYNHFNGSANSRNHSTHFQPLPPIENSLTFKPMRISSANTLKQTKEKSERPLTSTTTRLEANSNSLSKRSSTPSGLTSSNKGTNNIYTNNMKITGIRLSAEDPIYSANQASNSLTNYLSTKSFASISTNNSNNTVFSNLNYNNHNSNAATNANHNVLHQIGIVNNHHQASNRRNSIKESTQGLVRMHK